MSSSSYYDTIKSDGKRRRSYACYHCKCSYLSRCTNFRDAKFQHEHKSCASRRQGNSIVLPVRRVVEQTQGAANSSSSLSGFIDNDEEEESIDQHLQEQQEDGDNNEEEMVRCNDVPF